MCVCVYYVGEEEPSQVRICDSCRDEDEVSSLVPAQVSGLH